MTDIWDDPDVRKWAEQVAEELPPKIEDSSIVISLVPKGPSDVKFAVETGMAIMLDKPIILVVQPGTVIPAKLAKVADLIVEGPIDTMDGQQRLLQAIDKMMKEVDHE